MSETVLINTLLSSSNTPLSYRHLSAHLDVPNRDAQSLLLSYVSSHPNIQVLWCVTTLSPSSNRHISLTTNPPDNFLSKKVWAIASPDIQPLWLASDSHNALKLSAANVAESNPLRDGRFNPIKSDTGIWNPADKSASAVLQVPSKTKSNTSSAPRLSSVGQDKPFGGEMLAKTIQQQKDRAAKRSTSKKNFLTSFVSMGDKKKVNTSACSKLGAAALAKIRDANRKGKSTSSARKDAIRRPLGEGGKGRRVVLEESDDDDSDVDKEQEALQREEAEKERADKERERLERQREEAMREVKDLANDDDDDDEEPQSPTIRDLDERPAAMEIDSKTGSPDKRTPEKRKLNEAFGLPADNRPRRIKREVQETVMGEDGYVIERVVTKWFDEHGNEIVEGKVPQLAPANQKTAVKVNSKEIFTSSLRSKEATGIAQSGKSQQSGRKSKDAKKSAAKLGTSASKKASKKKAYGNIKAYFSQ